MDVFSMKSSRRKQSKPIRVSYDDPTGQLQLQPPPPLPNEEEYMNGDNMDTSDSEREKENEMHISNTSPSSRNSESFPALDLLNKKTVQEMSESSPLNLARESSYLTPYHRLGSEFLKGTGNFVPNGHNNSVLEGENNVDKNGNDTVDGEITDRKEEEESNGEKPKDRSGIFHPDAYCDLCDKEFCNKYFLKTHKANKHGIYENNTSPFPPSVNPLPPSLVLPQDSYPNLPLKLNMDYTLPPLKPLSNPAKSPTPVLPATPQPPPSPQRQTPPATQPLSQTPTKPPQSPLLPSKPKLSTDLISSDSKPISSSVNQDMEDFCEICQKHFCNKYYLKKHKNDVHGIPPPDAPLSSGKRGGRPPNSETKLPASSDSPLIPHSLANMPGLPNMPGVMVLNPFLPPMLIPAGSLMSQPPSLPPRPPHLPVISSSQPMSSSYPFSPSIPITSSSDRKSLSPGSANTSATSPSPSGPFSTEALRNMGIPIPDGVSPNDALRSLGLLSPDGQIPSDSFRGMGILNAEAFCDICRKEFCNKYFLKIHKANKHGVFMDEPILPLSLSSAMPPKPSDLTANTSDKDEPSSEKDRPKDIRDLKPDTSPKAATTPVSQPHDIYLTYCNLCSQEFASKYAYRIHRIQAHGMINETFNEAELAEEAFKLHNGELPKHISAKIAEEIAMMERSSEAGFSSMFGSMVAAKLADRVNCDICNKELCNKYFLKAHKLKVHGIDTTQLEKSPKPGTLPGERLFDSKLDFSPSSASRLDFTNIARTFNLKPEPKDPTSPKSYSRPTSASHDLPPTSGIEKPSSQELVKLGMDPEAYCEICKKEFCSKYFLRTHKQNIHGIPPKTESSDSFSKMPMSFSTSLSTNFSTAPHLALSAPLLPSPLLAPNISPSAGYSQIKPMNLSSSGSSGKSKNDRQTNSWRWKEPQNSSRVTCDLCNKELCNKYFLRTHKLNKHGIPLEDQSPTGSQNMSPSTSDVETSSNSSMPTDLTVKEKSINSPKLNLENSKLFTNKPDENPVAFSEALNLKLKHESDRYYNQYSETCHLCDRQFKSSKWLKQHILKDHAGLTALSQTMEKAFSLGMPGNRFAPIELRTCSVCSIVFPSEMSMQLHMIQEHNAQVTIKTDSQSPTFVNNNGDAQGSFSGISKKYALKRRFTIALKQKMYSCSVCSQKSKWLSKILSHERNIHGIDHNLKRLKCSSCKKVFRKDSVYKKHMMECHGNFALSDLDSPKRYRCMTCGRSFPSPILCHLHIRRDHIRSRSFHINNRISDRHSCSQCGFATRFRKQLQRHMLRSHNKSQNVKNFRPSGVSDIEEVYSGKNNNLPLHAEALDSSHSGDYVMQTFRIQQCNDEGVFVTSVVEMPVLKRLKNTASISFMVTPVEGR